jgi:hypothetical protein
MFKAPVDWISYYDVVIERCNNYIKTGYWEGIEELKLKLWLTNFYSDEEKYFAACLLDALVFRTPQMVNASFQHIATSIIPNFLNKYRIKIPDELDNWVYSLSSGVGIPLRIIAIEDVDKKTGKSGSVVIRDIKKSLDLAGHLSKKPEHIGEIPCDIKALVLIDDFAGTGEQFISFFQNKVKPYLNDGQAILYVPLAAHEVAITNIKEKCTEVDISPVELLSEEDSFFHPVNGYFQGDKENSTSDAKQFYLDVCKRRGFEKQGYLLGKGDLCLSFAFHLSTPNNNLKLLYHKPVDNSWNNLLYRSK